MRMAFFAGRSVFHPAYDPHGEREGPSEQEHNHIVMYPDDLLRLPTLSILKETGILTARGCFPDTNRPLGIASRLP